MGRGIFVCWGAAGVCVFPAQWVTFIVSTPKNYKGHYLHTFVS